MKIVIYGLAITSSWGNGHATTYRSLCKALAARGHRIDFVEKDLEWYRNNRDMPAPPFCRVHHYDHWSRSAGSLLRLAEDADAIVIGSYFPDAIAATQALLNEGCGPILFYDIDTPVTVAALRRIGKTSYVDTALVPQFAAYLSFTGGPLLRELTQRFGARCAVPLYCSVDPELHKPVSSRPEFRCDLSYLGTYAQDRQCKLMNLLNDTATLLPHSRFIVAGAQYPEWIPWQPNVKQITHLSPPHHPPLYSSSRFTLNLTRQEMIEAGYSPSVRLFEASACGAAILSDVWDGLEQFLEPNEEVLLPSDAYDVEQILRYCTDADRERMGRRARERVLSQHTAMHRAVEFEQVVERCSIHRPKAAAPEATARTDPARKPKAALPNMFPMPQL